MSLDLLTQPETYVSLLTLSAILSLSVNPRTET